MNKSLNFKYRIYRFCFLLFSILLFIYLLSFLINGKRGIFSYYEIQNINENLNISYENVRLKNQELIDKISRLSPNNLDLDYLDEQLIINSGQHDENSLVIQLNKDQY